MNLPVVKSGEEWHAGGLKFTCTQCGNCCSGSRGYVWITPEEIVRLGEFLGLTPEETVERYCRKVGGQFSLREERNSGGQYDCVFLREEPAENSGGSVVHGKRVCGVYAVRPLQCRTWPFWTGNLKDRRAWDTAAVHCHGMNRGREFSGEEIVALREAEEWPGEAPGSG